LCLCASCCQAYAHAALLITSTIKSEFSIWNEKHQLELQKIHCIFSTFFIKLRSSISLLSSLSLALVAK
jgi:hypothetical protein